MEGLESIINNHLLDLAKKIEQEENPAKRSELLLFTAMMREQKEIACYVREMRVDHNRRITDTEELVKKHDDIVLQGRTVLRVFSVIWVTVSGALAGVLIYGYALVADMRDTIIKQGIVLPRIEDAVNRMNQSVSANVRGNDVSDRINELNSELDKLKKLRVIRGSK
jgi:hypothetical protein